MGALTGKSCPVMTKSTPQEKNALWCQEITNRGRNATPRSFPTGYAFLPARLFIGAEARGAAILS